MTKKKVQTAAVEETGELGSLPDQETSNVDPRTDTESLANPLQRTVTVGRKGSVSQAAPNALEKLRPSGGA